MVEKWIRNKLEEGNKGLAKFGGFMAKYGFGDKPFHSDPVASEQARVKSQIARLISMVVYPKHSPHKEGGDEHLENFFDQLRDHRYHPRGERWGEKRRVALASQLWAISELGKTNSTRALAFLRYLSTESVSIGESYEEYLPQAGPSDALPVQVWSETYEQHSFPNARNPLKDHLKYAISTYRKPEGRWEQYRDKVKVSDIEKSRQQERALGSRPGHLVLRQAIASLEESQKTPVEIKRFSQEAREALEKQGLVIYGLTGQSIKTLRDSGRKFWSRWHEDLPDFEALGSMYSEVAINPNKLFLPESNNKTLSQQEDMVEKFSKELGKKVQGVKAIIGQAPDYAELAFAHFDATEEYLFGAKYNYDYVRTKTPTSGSNVANVGRFFADLGLGVNRWSAGNGLGFVHVAPLVVPTGK